MKSAQEILSDIFGVLSKKMSVGKFRILLQTADGEYIRSPLSRTVWYIQCKYLYSNEENMRVLLEHYRDCRVSEDIAQRILSDFREFTLRALSLFPADYH